MRKTMLIVCLLMLPLLTGCTMSDALFSVFGDHYTEGGFTRVEKEEHFNQKFQASQSYNDW